MTWIKLDDKTPRHPKIAGLTDRAFRAWIASMCYASEFLTDGVLPPAFISTVRERVRTELIAAGLWCVGDDASVSIHDYLDHQRDKASVRQQRDRNAVRQERHRNAKRNAVTNAKVTRLDKSREETTPPNPPTGVGGVSQRKPSKAETEKAESYLRAIGGRCPHDEPCANHAECVGRLVMQERLSLSRGMQAVAS